MAEFEKNPKVEVSDNPEESRFEAVLGGELAGAAYYRRHGDRLIFTHTEVDDQHEGRGIGSELARRALDTVRSRAERVAPLCPFIASYIRRHSEYADLIDTELTASLRR